MKTRLKSRRGSLRIPSLTNSTAGPYFKDSGEPYWLPSRGSSRSRTAARTGWRDATSRPSPSRGHLASAASPLHGKCQDCHRCVSLTDTVRPESRRGLERKERFTIRPRGRLPRNCTFLCKILPESGKIQEAKSPTCSLNQEEVLKSFKPNPPHHHLPPLNPYSRIPIWTLQFNVDGPNIINLTTF